MLPQWLARLAAECPEDDARQLSETIDNIGRERMKLATDHYLNKICNATIVAARFWQNSEEQYLYCIDYLDISADDPRADELVNILEDYFEDMLAEKEGI